MKAVIAILLFAISLAAAPPNPIAWKLDGIPSRPVKPGSRFSLKLTAAIEKGWHLYSTKPLQEGPVPTRIWLAEGQPFRLAGAIQSPPAEVVHDPNFDMEVELYEGSVVFTVPMQPAAAAATGPQKAQVSVSYQICSDTVCLPPRTVRVEAPVEVGR